MRHAHKNSAAFAACLMIAAGCSPSTESAQATSGLGMSQQAAVESSAPLTASPVDLGQLASLARLSDAQFASDEQTAEPQILPAKSATFDPAQQIDDGLTIETVPLMKFESGEEATNWTYGTSFGTSKRPVIDPGVYRTIEYKN